jgi:hypothetical protein
MRRLCFSLVRSLLIVVNLLATALALLLVYVSFTAFDQNYEIDSFSTTDSTQSPRLIHTYVSILFAGLGLIIALTSLLGLLGALNKSKSLLTTYATIVFLMVSILFVMVIITYTLSQQNPTAYKEIDKGFVNSTVVVYNHVDSSDMKTKFIDYIQRSYSCCGVNSPNDWQEYSLHKIPRSCCLEPVESSLPVFKYCAESDYKTGCWKALLDNFRANPNPILTVLYVFMSAGLICIAAAGFILLTIRKNLDIV